MGSNGIGQLGCVFDLIDRNQHLRCNLLVQLDVLFELRHHGARQRFRLTAFNRWFFDLFDKGFEIRRGFLEAGHARAPSAFDQNLHRAIGQFQQLQHRGNGADLEQIIRARIILASILLGNKQDLLVILHHRFQRADGFLTAHEKRHDHMREYNDIPQRQDRKDIATNGFSHVTSLWTVAPDPPKSGAGGAPSAVMLVFTSALTRPSNACIRPRIARLHARHK